MRGLCLEDQWEVGKKVVCSELEEEVSLYSLHGEPERHGRSSVVTRVAEVKGHGQVRREIK